MWAPSPSNKRAGLIFLLLLLRLSGAAAQGKIETDPLLEYQGDATTQSLYAIQEEAKQFLNRERPKRDPRIEVVGPDIREQYLRCAVPLTMRWRHDSTPYEIDMIEVICAKTNVKHTPSWHTALPVFDPVAHRKYIAKQKQKSDADAKKN